MAGNFDPYYEWLGIPPKHQPPNHYRLLGIEAFESNPDVIANAAEQRTLLVRTFQIGKHSNDSQRVLNEIATARIHLLNADKKSEYDARLRSAMAAPPVAPSVRSDAEQADRSSPTTDSSQDVSRAPMPAWLVVVSGLGGCVAAAAVVAFVIWLSIGGDDSANRTTADGRVDEPTPVHASTKPQELPARVATEPQDLGNETHATTTGTDHGSGALPVQTRGKSPTAQLTDDGWETPTMQAPQALQRPPLAAAPFDDKTAKQHQAAWAEYLNIPVEQSNSIGMRFVLIPPGEFLMGSADGEAGRDGDENPQHLVRITKPFHLGVTEVTQEQYERTMGRKPSGFASDPQRPVEMVSWHDAVAFCDRLSEKEGQTYRLPTEAEWEYACRAGTTTRWSSGDDEGELEDYAWFNKNSDKSTHPVGQKKPNPFGLYDVLGNVWEWCADYYSEGYYGESPQDDPGGPSVGGLGRVLRGGCWSSWPKYCRSAERGVNEMWVTYKGLGFRVAAIVSPKSSAPAGNALLRANATEQPPAEAALPPEQHELGAEGGSSIAAGGPTAGPQGTPPSAIAPFDEGTAKQHQVAWAKHLGVPVLYTNSIGMRFALIPPGEFDMGSTAEEVGRFMKEARAQKAPGWYLERLPSEAPKHRVRITRPYYAGIYEVTQAEYERVMGTNPSSFKGNPIGPVEQVNWHDTFAFCRRLSEDSREKAAGAVYRLLTEAEWEYACRAGTTTRFSFGDNIQAINEYAWCEPFARGRPQPVGRLQPNPWGLYDMHGNVWEWCQDWFGDGYYATSPLDDPAGPTGGSYRVHRGGSWGSDASDCRASNRFRDAPDRCHEYRGFRLARAVSLPSSSTELEKTEPAAKASGKEDEIPTGVRPLDSEELARRREGIGSFAEMGRAEESKLQESVAGAGSAQEIENSIGMKLVLIPAGQFLMGAPDGDSEARSNEKPQHLVRITKPFHLGVTEVTQEQYERVTGQNHSEFKGDPQRPVERVSWGDAVAFCRRLSEKEGRTYRLPTEAEWEYACRAGSQTKWSFGDDRAGLKDHAWYGENSDRHTHPVAQKEPNAFGLYDMHGNVWEWCQDWFGDGYYATSPLDDPAGPAGGSYRVDRGGSWPTLTGGCRSAYRSSRSPGFRSDFLGFRVALSCDRDVFRVSEGDGARPPAGSRRATETTSQP